MLRFCKENKESVINKMRDGQLDAVCPSMTGFVDEIMLTMHDYGILKCLSDGIPDKRKANTTVPFNLILALSVAAKMKIHTSLTDIPFAITDHRVLGKLGYAMFDADDDINKGLMTEGSLRALIKKYESPELVECYNRTVQNHIMPKLNISANIHILDCTDIEVNLKNKNYEDSAVVTNKYHQAARGYRLASLRGVINDTGVIEEIRFGSIDIHDLELSREMLYTSPMLKRGDAVVCDRGFLSREVMNYLKGKRGVDTYVPLRSNMNTFEMAVSTAKYDNKWIKHPTRKNQRIALVTDLSEYYIGEDPENNVDLNACVVWDTKATEKDKEYFVFITTDLTKSAKQIIQTYELRPEIEEDFRQIKDHWNIQDFRSKSLSITTFHIICVLFGYLFFQLYTMLPEGEQYAHKSLPAIAKNFISKPQTYLIFYVGCEFGILTLIEFAELFSACDADVKDKFKHSMG